MTDVRLAVYDHILSTGRVPLIREIAERVSQPVDQVSQRLRELQEIHAFALAPASDEILMAHPFSAVPTPYRVRGRRARILGELRVGRRRHSRHARLRCDGGGTLPGLPGIHDLRVLSGSTSAELRSRALSRRAAKLLAQRRLHVSNDPRLPVGSARRSLVRTERSPSRLRDAHSTELGARSPLVRRPLVA